MALQEPLPLIHRLEADRLEDFFHLLDLPGWAVFRQVMEDLQAQHLSAVVGSKNPAEAWTALSELRGVNNVIELAQHILNRREQVRDEHTRGKSPDRGRTESESGPEPDDRWGPDFGYARPPI